MQPLKTVVHGSTELASFAARLRRERDLTARLRGLVPVALAPWIEAVDATTETLVVATTSGATASALRQRAPILLASLQAEGWPFAAIKIRVQVRAGPLKMPEIRARPMDAVSLAKLETGRDALPEGPVKTALSRLIATIQGRS